MPTVRLIISDVRDALARMIADGDTFDLLITSPPFLALRSYLPADHPDKAREIGSEPTPAMFLDTLYGLTADWGRLLPEWASICVELGDTMSGSGGAGGDYNPDGLREGQQKFRQSRSGWHRAGAYRKPGTVAAAEPMNGGPGWPLAKSMCILPHAYTLGLAYGMNPLTGQPTPAGQWRIRNVITWARPNPPVGSLGKRNPQKRTGDYKFRPACSYITVACRGTGRYFDLDAVRYQPDVVLNDANGNNTKGSDDGSFRFAKRINNAHAGAPPLDWHTDHLDGDWLWKLATAPYPGAHYATYPLTLPRRLILAMCPSEVCIVCGWPRERVTTKSDRYVELRQTAKQTPKTDWSNHVDSRINGAVARASMADGSEFTAAEYITLGFTDCGCFVGLENNAIQSPKNHYRPGRVLDPFAGSGTTAVAAALEGRESTLIDLDPRNVDLIRRRLAEALHITSETHDGDVWTWTVEAPLPDQRQQVDGQANLFDLEPVAPKPFPRFAEGDWQQGRSGREPKPTA